MSTPNNGLGIVVQRDPSPESAGGQLTPTKKIALKAVSDAWVESMNRLLPPRNNNSWLTSTIERIFTEADTFRILILRLNDLPHSASFNGYHAFEFRNALNVLRDNLENLPQSPNDTQINTITRNLRVSLQAVLAK